MIGTWRVLLGSFVLALVAASNVAAFGRSGNGSASSYSYYYYAVPAYSYYYCPPVLPAVPVTVLPVPTVPYAIPTPAPASSTTEPPLAKPPMPPTKASNDARSPGLIAVRAASSPAAEQCRVVFWNLSGRDRTLTIDDQTVIVPKDRSIPVEVSRRFAWQLEQRTQRIDRVPDGQVLHDIVIRD